jgi:uncharacterized repeat protein (TIGR01451 family)
MQNPNRHTRFTITLLLLIALCAGLFAPSAEVAEAKPNEVAATTVVISEFRTRGPSVANAATDEFIELYNPTNSTISLAGLKLRRSSGCGTSLSDIYTFPSGLNLLPGQYYFVAGQNYSGVVTPDISLGTNMSIADNGGIAITDSANTAIDQVGMCVDTTYKEPSDGTGILPPMTVANGNANQSYVRKDGGLLDSCQDDNINSSDFQLLASNPQNSSTPRRLCGIPFSADLSIFQSASNSTTGTGTIFTIVLTNNGPDDATGIEVSNLLSGATYIAPYFASVGSYDAGIGLWTVENLASGSTATLMLAANVDTGGATNEVTIESLNETDSNLSNDTALLSISSSPTGSANLSVTKTVNNPTPNVNDNVVFTITVNNAGPDSATNIHVRDLFTTDLVYVSDNGGGTYNSTLGIWQAGTIASGASKTLNITARVATNGPKTNTASIFSLGQNDPVTSNNSASVTVTPGGGIADLRLAQAAPEKSTTVAGQVTFSITVTNDGPYNATNVVVRDKLPTGFTYVSDNSGGTYNKDTGLWPAGAIATTASKTLRITARVDPSGTMTNYAEIWSVDQSDPDSTPGNGSTNEDDDDSVTVQSADLSITKSMDNVTPTLGTNVVFTIRVNNAGPNNATGVQVKDILPSVYSYVSDDSGGQYNSNTSGPNAGIWNVGTLNNGETKTLRITATLVTNSIAINWAEVWRSDQVDIDSVPGNDSKNTDDDASAPFADLRLDQTVSNTSPGLNTNFTYTITVTNDGTVGTTGIQVRDKLPTGISYVGHSASTGSYSSTTGIWTVGTLATNASATLTITARITTSGVFINQAEVWKSDLPDPDSTPANNSTIEDDDANTTVYFRPILINEVAWAGTASNLPNDQWIELHNPSSVAVNITGWKLTSSGGNVNITLNGFISSGGFFLLERDDNTTVADISANQIYTGALSTSGETLTLRDAGGNLIDTANGNGGAWPRGTLSPNYATMERQGNTEESDSAWVTNTGVTKNGTNASGNPIYGTPGRANSTGVSPTAVPTATLAPVVIPPRPIINEVLPRPGFDWNQDGRIDIFDEFIEIKNIAPADLNLRGWRLDDGLNEGSAPFTLPDVTLKPGQRIAFYGLQTNILLSDGGDAVRLIDPNGRVYDIFTYSVASSADRSFCRLPDGSPTDNSWFDDCIPTPNLTNTREGLVPVMPGGNPESPVCQLPDTIPADFLIAECRGYGANIWNSYYWDRVGWQGRHYLPDNLNKWESFIE